MHDRLMIVALGATLLACNGNSTTDGGGTGVPPGNLTFLQLQAGAPALCADSTGKYFIKDPNGQDDEIALVFPENGDPNECNGGSTEDFLRLKIRKTSLLRRPNGTLIANGDSIFVWVKWVGNDSILFHLEPTGLTFDPAEPAELKIEYGEAGDDLNGDHVVNGDDDVVEGELDIYRQAHPGDNYVPVGTGKIEDENEIEAKLNGFSRYAIAY